MHPIYNFLSHSTFTYNEVIGIALNGVPIYPGRNKNFYDFISPEAYGTHITPTKSAVDLCLGELDGNLYHYRSYSPCIFYNQMADIAMMCSSDSSCSSGYEEYLAQYDTTDNGL